MSKLTENDRSSIEYFIKEKGDITRWYNWDEVKEVVQEEYPELIAALDNIVVAERTLEAIVSRISMEYDINE